MPPRLAPKHHVARRMHGFWADASRKVNEIGLTDFGNRGLVPRLYCAVEVASVPVAERGVSGVLSVGGWRRLRPRTLLYENRPRSRR
jgi:hypothetical protein